MTGVSVLDANIAVLEVKIPYICMFLMDSQILIRMDSLFHNRLKLSVYRLLMDILIVNSLLSILS